MHLSPFYEACTCCERTTGTVGKGNHQDTCEARSGKLSSNSFGVESFRSNSSGRSSMRKSTQQQCWLPPTLVTTFCRKI